MNIYIADINTPYIGWASFPFSNLEGIDVEDIPPGMDWSNAIQAGLDSCDVMLLILSPDSTASRNVEEEWKYFRDQGKDVLFMMDSIILLWIQ